MTEIFEDQARIDYSGIEDKVESTEEFFSDVYKRYQNN